MNIDPLFMTIGLAAFAAAVWLKLREMKAKREQERRIREAIERAQVEAAKRKARARHNVGNNHA